MTSEDWLISKDLKGSRLVYLNFYLGSCLEGLNKPRKTMINHNPAEIRTEYLKNANLFYVSADKIKQVEDSKSTESSGSQNSSTRPRGAGCEGAHCSQPPSTAVDTPDVARVPPSNSKNMAVLTGRI